MRWGKIWATVPYNHQKIACICHAPFFFIVSYIGISIKIKTFRTIKREKSNNLYEKVDKIRWDLTLYCPACYI